MDLLVPTPTLDFKPIDAGLAMLEKPIEVRCATVTFPDASRFEQGNLGTAGFFIYRQLGAVPAEVWNDEDKLWEPDPGSGVIGLKPKALIFKEGDPVPWRAPVVAAGQKDKNDQDQFRKAAPLFPQYFFRAYFAATRNGDSYSGLSGATSPIRFISALDAIRAGVKVGDGETPENATEVSLFLRDASRQFIGTIQIFSDSGSARIEISNRDSGAQKAVIRMLANGDVEIRPAAGRNIIMDGPIHADRIFYQPSDPGGAPVGAKLWLS
ncbi:MAG TPA: hypothetical protein VFU48_08170 [Nitrospira sp.]|nr:hypothetical protein [Nitrospira sp.]